MPSLVLSGRFPVFDKAAFVADYRAEVAQAVVFAARAFLVAAVGRVPVLTGFARSGFFNLEDEVGRIPDSRFKPSATNPLPTDSRKVGTTGSKVRTKLRGLAKARTLTRRTFYYYPKNGSRVVRTSTGGRAFSTKAGKIMSSRLTNTKVGNNFFFKFSYEIDIDYIRANEDKWGVFEAGRDAFDTELERRLNTVQRKFSTGMGKYFKEVSGG